MNPPREDRYKRYLDEIEKLLASTPSYPDLLNRRGVLKHYLGEPEEARRDFVTALSRNSRYEQARVNLAFALGEHDFRGALDLMANIAKESTTPVRRYVDTARLCVRYGHRPEAWDALFHTLDLAPDHPLALHWGAYFLFQEDRRREAKRWLLRAGRAPRGCLEAYEKLGVFEGGDMQPRVLAERIDDIPSLAGFAEIHRETARWLYTTGEEKTAVAELANILAIDPSFAPFATQRGWMEFLNGHRNRAERWLRKAVECDPSHSRAHEQLAQLYGANHDPIRAERHLTQAIALRPGYPDLRYDLALHCARTDRVEEAVSHLRSCLAIAPSFAMARLRLAECHARLGRFDAALQQLQLLPEAMRCRSEVQALAASCLAEEAHDPPPEPGAAEQTVDADPVADPAHG